MIKEMIPEVQTISVKDQENILASIPVDTTMVVLNPVLRINNPIDLINAIKVRSPSTYVLVMISLTAHDFLEKLYNSRADNIIILPFHTYVVQHAVRVASQTFNQ
jgi:hypothetical protein